MRAANICACASSKARRGSPDDFMQFEVSRLVNGGPPTLAAALQQAHARQVSEVRVNVAAQLQT